MNFSRLKLLAFILFIGLNIHLPGGGGRTHKENRYLLELSVPCPLLNLLPVVLPPQMETFAIMPLKETAYSSQGGSVRGSSQFIMEIMSCPGPIFLFLTINPIPVCCCLSRDQGTLFSFPHACLPLLHTLSRLEVGIILTQLKFT